MNPIDIIGLSGSLRERSYHTSLVRLAADQAPSGVILKSASIAELPLFNSDIQMAGMPSAVTDLGDQIRKADGIFIAAPEYNGTISSPLKNAIDWLSRLDPPIFHNKPIAIISASPGRLGGMRMQTELRKCLGLLGAAVLPRPEIYIASVSTKMTEEGEFLDESVPAAITQQLTAFAEWIMAMERAYPKAIS